MAVFAVVFLLFGNVPVARAADPLSATQSPTVAANIGTTGSALVGGRLYEWLGLRPLILVSGLATAACWLIVPLIRIDEPSPSRTSAEG